MLRLFCCYAYTFRRLLSRDFRKRRPPPLSSPQQFSIFGCCSSLLDCRRTSQLYSSLRLKQINKKSIISKEKTGEGLLRSGCKQFQTRDGLLFVHSPVFSRLTARYFFPVDHSQQFNNSYQIPPRVTMSLSIREPDESMEVVRRSKQDIFISS